jgi:hypothetical protein
MTYERYSKAYYDLCRAHLENAANPSRSHLKSVYRRWTDFNAVATLWQIETYGKVGSAS